MVEGFAVFDVGFSKKVSPTGGDLEGADVRCSISDLFFNVGFRLSADRKVCSNSHLQKVSRTDSYQGQKSPESLKEELLRTFFILGLISIV